MMEKVIEITTIDNKSIKVIATEEELKRNIELAQKGYFMTFKELEWRTQITFNTANVISINGLGKWR